MRSWLLMLICIGLLSGCSNGSESDPCDDVVCGEAQYCDSVTGSCLSYRCSTEHPNGSCFKQSEQCVSGSCQPKPCSADNPVGACEDPGQFCDEGSCRDYPCSGDHPDGVCSQGDTCYLGSCRGITCSTEQPDGLCPENSICEGGSCVTPSCSLFYTKGICDSGKSCVRGSCVDDDLICSSKRIDGLCPFGERCSDGSCVTLNCGENAPDGVCSDGEYCASVWDSAAGHYRFSCEKNTCSQGDPDGACKQGKICQQGRCVIDSCNGLCQQHQVCQEGFCLLNELYCSQEQPNGWCPEGESCYRGVCRSGTETPCDQQVCSGRNSCLMVGGLALCISWEEQCSPANRNGQCDDGMSCLEGRCVYTRDNPCGDVTCGGDQVCHPESGLCYDSRCSGASKCPENSGFICVNDFQSEAGYRCVCQGGMVFNVKTGQCETAFNPCDGIDCGAGSCVDTGVDTICVCNEGAQNRTYGGDDICVYPESYPYCDDITCGTGTCRVAEITIGEELVRYPVCDCFGATIFDPRLKQCVHNDLCGDQYCEPGRSECVVLNGDRYCDLKRCSETYPKGSCFGAGECLNGNCIPRGCSEGYPEGDCPDQYSCVSGICCRNGDCSDQPDQKPFGATCEPGECGSGGICLGDPAGINRCYELCSDDDPCKNNQQQCVSGGITFNGERVPGVGICLEDQNCIENSCSQFQQCLFYQRSGVSACFEKGSVATGDLCTAQTLCGEGDICLNGRCVNRCGSGSDPLCFDQAGDEVIITGGVNHYGKLPFQTAIASDTVTYCNSENLCDSGSCLTLWGDTGICSTVCDPAGEPFGDQCDSGSICYSVNGSGICLAETDCDPVKQRGCSDDQICYPVTDQLSGCSKAGTVQPGGSCDFDSNICERGHCINGVCALLCDRNAGCIDAICGDTGDLYDGETLFSGTPYGLCQ